MRQLLLQGLILSGTGCVLGLGLVIVALKLFENQIAAQLNVHIKLQPDGMVIFALLGDGRKYRSFVGMARIGCGQKLN